MATIASQLLAPNIAALREFVSSIRSAPNAASNPGEAYRTIAEAHASTLSAIENIAQIVDSLEARTHSMEARAHSTRKPLAESKCVSNLKILSSDKSEFKNWNEKLINAT